MDSSQHRTYLGARDALASWRLLTVHHAPLLLPDLLPSVRCSSFASPRRVALHTSGSTTYTLIWRHAFGVSRRNCSREHAFQVIDRVVMWQYVGVVSRSVVLVVIVGHSRDMAILLCNLILPQQWRCLRTTVAVFTVEQFNQLIYSIPRSQMFSTTSAGFTRPLTFLN